MIQGKDIHTIRQEVDRIDREILDLVNRRAEMALEIGRSKRTTGRPIADRSREMEVLASAAANNPGPLPEESIRHIFTEIISGCRRIQGLTRVCYLGPEATFTNTAAIQFFGRSTEMVPLETIRDVFREVEAGRADYGVAPVENTIEGGVGVTLDCFLDSGLKICGEICLGISHVLMSATATATDIKRVYSHPQALAQCREWLARRLPGVELIHASSTGAAAKKAEEESGSAAVGGEMLAERYNLNILERDIQDRSVNLTRFFVLGREDCARTGRDKTSIWFTAPHRPGALYDCLKYFSKQQINMTRIESRPGSEVPWEYVFFLDFEGHISDEPVAEALSRLGDSVERVRVMGSYPAAVNLDSATSAINTGVLARFQREK